MRLDTSVKQLHQQAEYYLSQKKYSEAIAICQQALSIQKNLNLYKILGIAFQMKNQLEKALQSYLKVLEIKPDYAEVYHQIGELYAQQKQWKDAIIIYQVALRLDAKLERTYLSLGNALVKLSQFDEAIACYHQLINYNSNSAIGYQKLGDVLFKLQQWDNAILAFHQVLKLNPNSLWSYQHLGKIYLHKQQWEKAIEACYQAIKINPRAPWSYNNLGDALSHKQQWNYANIAYIYAIKVKENTDNVGFLNTIYQRLGYAILQQIQQSNLESVIDWYSELFQREPEHILIHYPVKLSELGFTDNDPNPYLQFGEALVKCQQFEAAIIFHKLALKIQLNHPEIIKKLEQVYEQQQRFKQVLAECYQNIHENPNSPDAYTKLGNILTQQGQAKEAVYYHQKALILKGWYLCKQRDYQFTQDWFSNNIPIWKKHLSFLRHTPELNILEIGSYQGMSTCWFLDSILTHPTAKITCIDPYFKPEFDHNIAQTNGNQKVIKKIGYSQDLLSSLPEKFYDIVYIDGSHQAIVALKDALQSWGLIKVGGIIIFDDYEVEEVDNPEQQAKVGIDYFLNWVSDSIEVLHQGYQLIIRKKETGLNEEGIATVLSHLSKNDFTF